MEHVVKEYNDCRLVIFDSDHNIDGFQVQSGFAGLEKGDYLVAVTSGLHEDDSFFVYRRSESGWKGDWEDNETFPVADVEEVLREYDERQDFKSACEKADIKEEPLYDGEDFSITTTVAGEKCNDGGEYGFWKTYSRTNRKGVYRIVSHTTCDIDACGTGYIGYDAITCSDYERLMVESERVEARGSLYN